MKARRRSKKSYAKHAMRFQAIKKRLLLNPKSKSLSKLLDKEYYAMERITNAADAAYNRAYRKGKKYK